jgi:hypothetical protein
VAGALSRRRVAFLFLGETLLIPHLWPIVEALAELDPTLPIDVWVSTSVHEVLLGAWAAPYENVRLRRAPGFYRFGNAATGRNPPLPPKIPTLARLLPYLLSARVAVSAEQTSLWLPTAMPLLPVRFVKTAHGAGSMSARDDRRRRRAWLTLVPGEAERAQMLAHGFPPERLVVTGYIKAASRHRTQRSTLFPDVKPVLLYTPHWQEHRSSWWAWGREIVAMLARQTRFNVILAPHQRLVEKDPEVAAVLAEAGRLPHIHADIDSFAMVDGSYTEAADLYLGDTSSQVVEFLARPRPCIFLNAQGTDWRGRPDLDFWTCGEVVDDLDRLEPAIAEADQLHQHFRAAQERFALDALGDTGGAAPRRAAEAILRAVDS